MAGSSKKGGSDHRKKVVKLKTKFSWKNLFLYFILVIFALFFFSAFSSPLENSKNVPLSQIIESVKKGEVKELVVSSNKIVVTKQNGDKLQASKEPNANVYTLFKDSGTTLDPAKVKVNIKDDTTAANWINITMKSKQSLQ